MTTAPNVKGVAEGDRPVGRATSGPLLPHPPLPPGYVDPIEGSEILIEAPSGADAPTGNRPQPGPSPTDGRAQGSGGRQGRPSDSAGGRSGQVGAEAASAGAPSGYELAPRGAPLNRGPVRRPRGGRRSWSPARPVAAGWVKCSPPRLRGAMKGLRRRAGSNNVQSSASARVGVARSPHVRGQGAARAPCAGGIHVRRPRACVWRRRTGPPSGRRLVAASGKCGGSAVAPTRLLFAAIGLLA